MPHGRNMAMVEVLVLKDKNSFHPHNVTLYASNGMKLESVCDGECHISYYSKRLAAVFFKMTLNIDYLATLQRFYF